MNKKSIIVKSPGRINIIGEHTDYNDGFVLPAAIDKNITVKMQKNGTDTQAKISDTKHLKSFSFDLQNFAPRKKGWHNYIMGVVHELQNLGGHITGFNAEFESNVPIGGGMSSSAALECSFAYALNELFHLGFDKWQLIKASQRAEHNYVGNNCGIMDQFASVMGKKDQVMLLDCRSLEYEYFPLELEKFELLLLNTNVAHSLASSEYNTRREECEEGVSILKKELPEINSLRDVSLQQLDLYKSNLHDQVFKRCTHVINESERVLSATQAMKSGNYKLLGELVYASHFSLQNDYEVSCTELDFLVQETINKDFILGSRMMGGGFGGCTINMIDSAHVESFKKEIAESYHMKFGVELTPYSVSIENGTHIVT
jgi:galactokinase